MRFYISEKFRLSFVTFKHTLKQNLCQGDFFAMKLIFLIIVLCLFTACESAETTPAPIDEKQALQEIMQAERRLVVSVQRKDMEALNQIWADEYLGTAPNGRVVDKADLMAAVKGGAIEVEQIEFGDLKLRLFSNIGIVTGRADVKAHVSEEDYSGSYRGTGIFIKRADGWHPVGVHVSSADWKPGEK